MSACVPILTVYDATELSTTAVARPFDPAAPMVIILLPTLPPLPPTLEEGLEGVRSIPLSCLVGVPTIRFETPIAPFGAGAEVPIPPTSWLTWRPRSVCSALPRPVLSSGDNVLNILMKHLTKC